MRKEIIKESNKKILLVDIVLYMVFVIVGYFLLNIEEPSIINLTECTYTLFYLFGFFALFAYFVNRIEDNYEFLMFGFINVCIATFILIFSNYPNTGFILSDAILIYAIANVINKFYYSKQLFDKKDINFFPKFSIALFLLLLGVFVVSSLYSKVQVANIILGYYFVIFGLLSLLEPLIKVLLNNKKIEQQILDILSYNKVDEEKQEEKETNKKTVTKVVRKVKEAKKSRPVVKEKVVNVNSPKKYKNTAVTRKSNTRKVQRKTNEKKD